MGGPQSQFPVNFSDKSQFPVKQFFTIPVNCWLIPNSQQISQKKSQFPAIFWGQSQLPVNGHPDPLNNTPIWKIQKLTGSWEQARPAGRTGSIICPPKRFFIPLGWEDGLYLEHWIHQGKSWWLLKHFLSSLHFMIVVGPPTPDFFVNVANASKVFFSAFLTPPHWCLTAKICLQHSITFWTSQWTKTPVTRGLVLDSS